MGIRIKPFRLRAISALAERLTSLVNFLYRELSVY